MPSTLRLALILGALIAFAPMSIDMYLPAFPALQQDFATTAGNVQMTLSLFLLGLAVGQLLYGPLADRYGRKPPLYAGLAVYVLASGGAALAGGIDSLILLRLAQALGGCAGMVLTRAIVRDIYTRDRAASVLAYIVMAVISPTPASLISLFLQIVPTLLLFPFAHRLIERFEDGDVRFR